jgi:monofunctional biosynthetic peptidoglycan transglycosylase
VIIFRWFFRILLLVFLAVGALILAYRVVTPVSTLMIGRWITGASVERTYVPLARISPHLAAAVIASEDARFCLHHGVDWGALNGVIKKAGKRGPSRGASTIPMQTAKNLFLWPGRSVVRKGLEIPLALAIDAAWPKRRLLEIYLNIAEWGDGIFGAEAAARFYFKKSAHDLTSQEAALLATALPNPHLRDPGQPHRGHAVLARNLMARVGEGGVPLQCVE